MRDILAALAGRPAVLLGGLAAIFLGILFLFHDGRSDQDIARLAAVEGPPPSAIPADSLSRSSIPASGEIAVFGRFKQEWTHRQTSRTMNGTEEIFVYFLVGPDQPSGMKSAFAAVPVRASEEETFRAYLAQSVVGEDERGPIYEIRGLENPGDTRHDRVLKGLDRAGFALSPSFVYITPFYDGREAGLLPPAVDNAQLMTAGGALVVVLVLFGFVKVIGGGGSASKGERKPIGAGRREPEEIAQPKAQLSSEIDPNSPLARIHRKATAGAEGGSA